MKPTIVLDDPKIRRIWENCVRARDEVASWPAWKRSEDVLGERPPLPAAATDAGTPTPKP